jgi:hypothetical protein
MPVSTVLEGMIGDRIAHMMKESQTLEALYRVGFSGVGAGANVG